MLEAPLALKNAWRPLPAGDCGVSSVLSSASHSRRCRPQLTAYATAAAQSESSSSSSGSSGSGSSASSYTSSSNDSSISNSSSGTCVAQRSPSTAYAIHLLSVASSAAHSLSFRALSPAYLVSVFRHGFASLLRICPRLFFNRRILAAGALTILSLHLPSLLLILIGAAALTLYHLATPSTVLDAASQHHATPAPTVQLPATKHAKAPVLLGLSLSGSSSNSSLGSNSSSAQKRQPHSSRTSRLPPCRSRRTSIHSSLLATVHEEAGAALHRVLPHAVPQHELAAYLELSLPGAPVAGPAGRVDAAAQGQMKSASRGPAGTAAAPLDSTREDASAQVEGCASALVDPASLTSSGGYQTLFGQALATYPTVVSWITVPVAVICLPVAMAASIPLAVPILTYSAVRVGFSALHSALN